MPNADPQPTERLARMETTMAGLHDKVSELAASLAVVITELRRRDDDLQVQVSARAAYCAAQVPNYAFVSETLKDHEQRIKAVEQLMPTLKFVLWIGGALGLSVLALIWSLVTGQAQVIFP